MTRFPGEYALDHQVVERVANELVLVASRCANCGDVHYPPRELCVQCLGTCERLSLSREGTVYEAVRVDLPPLGFEKPYWVAYVDFPEQVRVFGPMALPEDHVPQQGDRVRYEIQSVRSEPIEVLGPVFARY